ncbi:hypothetical protein WJX72_003297 [[Myrmecia] bisecta]|uniref:Early light-induced protein n=1 Tax=[Myrmecia] bisecta TaxID=41462 RepID=A0AAW1R5R7_9CHLO
MQPLRSSNNNEAEPSTSEPATYFYGGRSYTPTEWKEVSKSGALASPPSVVTTPAGEQPTTQTTPGVGELMAFNGAVPETTNGRLAMLGFVAALFAELASGKGVLSQWSAEPTLISLTFFVFIAASIIPFLNNAPKEPFGPFTPKAEMVNGRAAMIGFAALLIIEAVKGSALF